MPPPSDRIPPSRQRSLAAQTPEFFAELAQLAKPKVEGKEGTFGAIVLAYKRSPLYANKALRTKVDYEKGFDYLQPLFDMPMAKFTAKRARELQTKAFQVRKRRFANYVMAVVGLVCAWGVKSGHCPANPAAGIKDIPRDPSKKAVNRPWTDEELVAVLSTAPVGIKTAVLLGCTLSLRGGDVVKVPWSIYNGEQVRAVHGKNNEPIWVTPHPMLKVWLDQLPNNPLGIADPVARKKAMAEPIVQAPRLGERYTLNGFRGTFKKFVAELEAKGPVGEGLTIHGLRHSVATRLAEVGATTQQIMSITGHRDEQIVKVYVSKANKKLLADKAMGLLKLPGSV
jgi:integrase